MFSYHTIHLRTCIAKYKKGSIIHKTKKRLIDIYEDTIMRKTNLLWLSDRLYILGEVETLLLNLANELDLSRFNVYSGVFKMGYVASYFEKLRVQVMHIPRKGKFDLQVIPRLAKTIIELKNRHNRYPWALSRYCRQDPC